MPEANPCKELKPSTCLPDLKGGSSNMPTFDRFVVQGSPFVRLAGLSGASAVALGAYGAHSKYLLKQHSNYH